ncbi:spore coat U domain-containing protein [Yersinia ruckeri]|uniref:Csu type fimbrial protein n=1 Tax=Yersinia ruckeri TaxID=29486 RepID=UPI0004E34D5E|nr:spore coat U domain-containing protein [Yersinia ruckeri]ARY99408.1 Spore Coat Protein U domain protein [Yersinia ruckeri]EKN3345682.1 spore coat protein U domain-containing protein [Yersinia ruckeri]EKN3361428.1 spore coat protein U domain-containing protein [Yersinia ruckeri]EKN4182750.1 spore coat protein U domain-containing protein [Yersinia ruckeri]EKN4198100.1 spore coat protein U domain-containing protein [Yersinia ruckeri]
MGHKPLGISLFIRNWPFLLFLFITQIDALPTQTFQVAATIANGCLISGTNTGVFGQIDFGTIPGNSTAQITGAYSQNSSIIIACTPGTSLNMGINGGSNFTTVRNMKHSTLSYLVPYNLYNTTNNMAIPVNSNIAISFSDNTNIMLPIYGLLTLNGSHYSGVYTDTLTVTLSW